MKINTVTIYVANLVEMKEFYHDVLQFPLESETETNFTLQFNGQKLIVKEGEADNFYHLAFTIPENSFQYVKTELAKHTNLAKEKGEDEIYFKFLNAHSIYFEDPAGNIIEFITREINLTQIAEQKIGQLVIGIGEVGFPATDPDKLLADLNELAGKSLNVIDGAIKFAGDKAIGHYIVIVPDGRRWIFSEKDAKFSEIKIETDRFILGCTNDGEEYLEKL